MAIRKVGVVGCGLMGSGIAQVCAQKGFPVVVREPSPELLQKGLQRIQDFLTEGVKKGKVTEQEKDATLGNIKGTTDYKDLADCDIVIEAVVENMALKKEVFAAVDKVAKPETIIASNTSSLSITEMAAATRRMDRCIGMHFMNPVPLMKLVEIVRPEVTSQATYDAVKSFGEALGKVVVTAKDTPGFIVNYLLVPFMCDAVRMVENGVCTKEDLDTAIKLGLNHPMGPIELLDYVGLDTTLFIAEALFAEFKDPKYAAPPLLKRMVLSGRLGRKTGRGFYEWEGNRRK